MTDLSRRSFLRGALTVAAVAVSPLPALALAPAYPILHGDGIHDDTAALNAMLSGKPVICEGKLIEHVPGAPIELRHGRYLVSGQIELSVPYTTIAGTREKMLELIGADDFDGDNGLLIRQSAHDSTIEHVHMHGVKARNYAIRFDYPVIPGTFTQSV